MKKEVSCPHCGKSWSVYSNPTPTTDVVIYEPGRGVVIIKRGNPPYGHALPGGFIDEGEQAEAAAVREMQEEIGLTEADLENISLRYVTLRHKNHEIRQIYYFFAEVKEDVEISMECDEGELRWVPMKEAVKLDMPYTAGYVVKHYLKEGKDTEALYGGFAQPDKVEFVELEAWE